MLGQLYLFGFVVALVWMLYAEVREGPRCCWVHDALIALFITIFAVLWPLVLVISLIMGFMLIHAERRREG